MLDLERAFDSASREKLFSQLHKLHIRPAVIQLLTHWHINTQYHFQHGCDTVALPTGAGLRQGCKAAPGLWSFLLILYLQQVTQQIPIAWLRHHLNIYADDYQVGGIFYSVDDLRLLLKAFGILLQTLHDFSLRINPKKSAALLTIAGTSHRHQRAQFVTTKNKSEQLRIPLPNGDEIQIPAQPTVACDHAFRTGHSNQQALSLAGLPTPLQLLRAAAKQLLRSITQRMSLLHADDLALQLPWSHLEDLVNTLDSTQDLCPRLVEPAVSRVAPSVLYTGPCAIEPTTVQGVQAYMTGTALAAGEFAVRHSTMIPETELSNLRGTPFGLALCQILEQWDWDRLAELPEACQYLAKRCILCGLHYNRVQELNAHYRTMHGQYWEGVPQRAVYMSNTWATERPCPFCGALFKSHLCPVWVQVAVLLLYGVGVPHDTPDNVEAPSPNLRCEVCLDQFEDLASLTEHLRNAHALQGMTFNVARDSVAGSPACAHCGALHDTSTRADVWNFELMQRPRHCRCMTTGCRPAWGEK
ncbi:unnamed protein product [Cladocopium goreaui]|uniref:LINE-1 retrotransposable element ORF2 protein n=1 Tax=Cladocopium goreaui TaxID=2562237 RepID=A0A9P1CYL6_9DINO|nr:unnamed protein product [Cladocopium goreaui]